MIYSKEKEQILAKAKGNLLESEVVHYSLDNSTVPDIPVYLELGRDLSFPFSDRMKTAMLTLKRRAISQTSSYTSEQEAVRLAFDNRDSIRFSCHDELWEKSRRTEAYKVLCSYLQIKTCLGQNMDFDQNEPVETAKVERSIGKLLTGISPDEIRSGFWRRILGEPSLRKKARFLYNRWSKEIEDEFPQVQSCKLREELAAKRALQAQIQFDKVHDSLLEAWEQNDITIFGSDVLATKRKFEDLLRELEHQAVELPLLHKKIKECSYTGPFEELISSEQRAIVRLKTEVDARSVRLLEVSAP